MNADAEAAIRHIYEQWHETVVRRDIRGLMELYAEDAILESPLICAVQPELGSGILRGKSAIGDFFAAGSRTPSNGLGRWYRTGHFFANGRQLTWEYPRATPDGDQIDLVEVMDMSDGLITYHRVYWGWKGFEALLATLRAKSDSARTG
jgi:steroid delta-isomerase